MKNCTPDKKIRPKHPNRKKNEKKNTNRIIKRIQEKRDK